MPDISVCIVNWNTRDLLRTCLQTLFDTAGTLTLQVIVVDNASADDSAKMVAEEFPQVELIANTDNRFYAAGNNQALQAATAPWKLLLNSDIEIPPGGLQTLLDWAKAHPKCGAIAPRLVYPDGRPQLSCRSFPDPDTVWFEALGLSKLLPKSRIFGKYRMSYWDYNSERTVDQPMASALLLRSEALAQVGIFDEDFPMFFNDVDLCKRLVDAGWEVWYTPDVTMVHHHGASTKQARREMVAESGRSFLYYYKKHYYTQIHPLCYWLTTGLLQVAYAWRIRRAR